MLMRGAREHENVGGALRAATGRFGKGPEIAAGDSGSHFPVLFSERNTLLSNAKARRRAISSENFEVGG